MNKNFRINPYSLVSVIFIPILLIWFQSDILELKFVLVDVLTETSDRISVFYYNALALRSTSLLDQHIFISATVIIAGLLGAIITIINTAFRKLRSDISTEKSNPKKKIKVYSAKRLKYERIIMITALLVLFLFFYITGMFYVVVTKQVETFEHKLKIISMVADEEEIKKIEFEWSMMENREDFERVNKRIKATLK